MTRRTEQRHPGTTQLDVVDPAEAIRLLLAEDRAGIEAAAAATPELAAAVELAVAAIRGGGVVHYFGAGASGRLAVLDESELRPTFGIPRHLVTAHFPGGTAALLDPAIDLEDDVHLGADDAMGLTRGDLAVGVTASGGTGYVRGALERARSAGASTVLVTCTPESPLAASSDVVVVLDTGPEVLTGSTRLKAGTATKAALNAFSTATMVRLGRTYSNLMVGMSVTNDKLRHRAVAVLADASGRDAERCVTALAAADDDLPTALVALIADVDVVDAADALRRHDSVRDAVAALKESRDHRGR